MFHRIVALGALVASLSGVQQPAVPLRTYLADHGASRLFVVTHRTGLLSFLGHDHAILPTAWHADLCMADPVPPGAPATLVVLARALVIDSDSARTLAGLGHGPDNAERRQIQGKMLDANHLDADRYPHIRLDLRPVPPSAPGRLTVQGSLRIHGVTRQVAFPVTVEHAQNGTLQLSGTLRIGQRDFGIKPESVAGVVKVANDVDLHFLLSVRPTPRACSAPMP